jgi:hypothetical protein
MDVIILYFSLQHCLNISAVVFATPIQRMTECAHVVPACRDVAPGEALLAFFQNFSFY